MIGFMLKLASLLWLLSTGTALALPVSYGFTAEYPFTPGGPTYSGTFTIDVSGGSFAIQFAAPIFEATSPIVDLSWAGPFIYTPGTLTVFVYGAQFLPAWPARHDL